MSAERLRVAAFGSPAFAVATLDALHAHHDLVLVVTQPDRPAGRTLAPRPPAAAVWAREHGVPLAQPERLKRDEAFRSRLAALELDVAVTAAYGKILPPSLLSIPRHGFLNVHASLLPAYRGAAPVQRALIDGCRETGVSIMQTEAGLDTGPVRHAKTIPIREEDDARTLMAALAELGAEALLEALELLAAGRLPSRAQDDERASHAPMLTREDGMVRWEHPRRAIVDRHRGVALWPGSWTLTPDGASLKIHRLAAADVDQGPGSGGRSAEPGTVLEVGSEHVRVACGDGAVDLLEVQAAGRARMGAAAWARGARLRQGDRLG